MSREHFTFSPQLNLAFLQFIDDMLAHAFVNADPDELETEGTDPVLKTLVDWTLALPSFAPGRFTTSSRQFITLQLIDTCFMHFVQHEQVSNGLYPALIDQLDENCDEQGNSERPTKSKKPKTIDEYCRLTPFMRLVDAQLSISLKQFKEMHWCMFAKSGSGKTSLLAAVLLDHLAEPDPPAMIVIDPHEELAHDFEQLEHWKRSGRLLIVDPSELPSFNLFEGGDASSLFSYMFSLEGAELTSLQAPAFAYLLSVLELRQRKQHTTIRDLLALATSRDGFEQYISQMDNDTRNFFSEFYRGANATREGIKNRLRMLIKQDPLFIEMFSGSKNKLNLFNALHKEKKTIVITANGLKDGRDMFMRFIIMQCVDFAFKRKVVPKSQRHPVLLFVDEAQLVLKGNAEVNTILTETRKFGLFLRTFTQEIEQVKDVARTLISQADVRITGVLDPDDNAYMAKRMNCDPSAITRQKKTSGFAYSVYVDPHIPKPVTLALPGPPLDHEPKMTALEHRAMRELLCRMLRDDAPKPDPSPQATPSQDKPQSTGADPTKPMDLGDK